MLLFAISNNFTIKTNQCHFGREKIQIINGDIFVESEQKMVIDLQEMIFSEKISLTKSVIDELFWDTKSSCPLKVNDRKLPLLLCTYFLNGIID